MFQSMIGAGSGHVGNAPLRAWKWDGQAVDAILDRRAQLKDPEVISEWQETVPADYRKAVEMMDAGKPFELARILAVDAAGKALVRVAREGGGNLVVLPLQVAQAFLQKCREQFAYTFQQRRRRQVRQIRR